MKNIRLLLAILCFGAATAAPGQQHSEDSITVEVPAGCAPRLPYRLWVQDSDGRASWRQVRWQNSSPIREQAEADTTLHPAGTTYQVLGYVIGDDMTPKGRPVTANVSVGRQAWPVPPVQPVAQPLPLNQVSIDGDNRLTHNRDLDISHLLTLDPLQQLYNYRDTYGLSTDGYPVSDGWDSPTTKLKGHGTGHYLSALAMAFASCQDEAQRALLRQRMQLMVDEMRRCQELTFLWSDSLGRYFEARDLAPTDADLQHMGGTWADFDRYKQDCRHYGYGYLNAIPPQHCLLTERYTPYNNESGVWAPYYTVHKQLAGLIDVATYTDDPATAAKALRTATDMGLWVWNRMHYRTFVSTEGDVAERRQRPGNRYEMWNMYIAGEVGGMAESLARLAQMSSDSTERARLLEAATSFDSPAFLSPLTRAVDAIRTRHANQHIPMVTGALHCFRAGAGSSYYDAALNFWLLIQGRYRYAMGGVGNGEMFRQPYAQMTAMTGNKSSWGGVVRDEPTMNETCCAYNLAKLTKDLACHTPNDARFMDYYERVLCNQLVGSLNPHRYQTVYQYAVGLNASKPWGNETPQESCCGGTGAENHVKYQEATYFVGADTLWVNLYMPTTAHWQQQGIVVRQQCQWPAERSLITLHPSPSTLHPSSSTLRPSPVTLRLRVPYWAGSDFDIRLNGRSLADSYQPGTYFTVAERRWSAADTLEVVMPFHPHIDYGPDKADGHWLGTLMLGPLCMATTGIDSWQQATTDRPTPSDLQVLPPLTGTGADACVHRLSFAGHTFLPDYYLSEGITHYLRFNASEDATHGDMAQTDISNLKYEIANLEDLLLVARQRQQEQQQWMALAVKVPDYAPWAPHAFARMEQQADSCQQQLEQARQQLAPLPSTSYPPSTLHPSPSTLYPSPSTLHQLEHASEALNATLNSMRPGNLPELEDLQPLMQLTAEARRQPSAQRSRQLSDALDYAGMVIRYVSDGSGTHDMIARAVSQLQQVLADK